jgi:pimeloyl-ACP methyl ester carboxylesterase
MPVPIFKKRSTYRHSIRRTLGIHLFMATLAVAAPAIATAAVVRGSLIDAPVVLTTLTTAQIDAATASASIQTLSGKAKCDVKVVALHYNSIGTQGEDANVSGVMLVPAGTCNGAAALVAYAKGTDVEKPHTLANASDSQTLALAAFLAAQGYAVVATDYLGFAKSSYPYHPYLHADSEASSVIDSVRAARNAASAVGATLSGKVMITGYSQGGHASMAAQRAAERDNAAEITVLGGVHMAGPYNLSGYFRTAMAIVGAQAFVPYAITSWQKVYGNVYGNVNDVFQMPYADYIETLLPSATLTFGTLASTGKLPGANNETPDQALNMVLQPTYRTDIQTNPNNGVYLAAQKNDLLDWTPVSKVLLCGGSGDPTVQPAVHQQVMKAAFDRKGLTNVTSVDVDPAIRAVFGVVLAFSPATYYASYHGTLEPAFCLAQAKPFLDNLVTAGAGLAADADKVFDWAERTYAFVFSPAGQSATVAGYRYRSYGNHYLAVNEIGTPHLYYLGPLSLFKVLDLGLLSDFVALAR